MSNFKTVKIMKKYLIIFIAALSFASCSDILDLSPTTSVTDAAVWQDPALIVAYHTELYNSIEHGFRSWNNWQSKATDEVYPAVNWGPCMFQHGTLSPDNVDGTLYYWDKGYQYLRKINIFLDKTAQLDFDLPNKARLVAEVKFLKAWIYFVLTTRFGSAVLIDEYWDLSQVDGVAFSRSSFAECVAEIEKLIAEAMPDLPQTYMNTDANFGRASQDVCRALLSRMYLYFASPLYNPTNDRAKWQKAADAT
ncbi:RagB/SusD family nutrient uptake outer membrane protein, partial [Parabacteroides sp. OttesenSCG-928-J18]|nr:RagB/SusD family nutrient uptake outer membrane protein [Parabacteroides sp. OttesenSCG-928-J18]